METDVSGNKEPGTVDIKLIDRVELLINFKTCPAVTNTTTVPPVLSVSSTGYSLYPEKQLPGTGTPSSKKERDHAGTGEGKGGVNCPSSGQESK